MSNSPKTDRLREMREARHSKTKPTPGERIIEGLKEAVEIAQGKREPAKSNFVNVTIASAAATLGSKGGKSKSHAKRSAAKENGKKGGRPVATYAEKTQAKPKRSG